MDFEKIYGINFFSEELNYGRALRFGVVLMNRHSQKMAAIFVCEALDFRDYTLHQGLDILFAYVAVYFKNNQ